MVPVPLLVFAIGENFSDPLNTSSLAGRDKERRKSSAITSQQKRKASTNDDKRRRKSTTSLPECAAADNGGQIEKKSKPNRIKRGLLYRIQYVPSLGMVIVRSCSVIYLTRIQIMVYRDFRKSQTRYLKMINGPLLTFWAQNPPPHENIVIPNVFAFIFCQNLSDPIKRADIGGCAPIKCKSRTGNFSNIHLFIGVNGVAGVASHTLR